MLEKSWDESHPNGVESFVMNSVGTMKEPCYKAIIPPEEKITYIDTGSDGKHLRKIQIHLTSGLNVVFGNWTGELKREHSRRFDFSDGEDVIGAFGMVHPDEPFDHINSMGFIMNECPVRGFLDMEKEIEHPNRVFNSIGATVLLEDLEERDP